MALRKAPDLSEETEYFIELYQGQRNLWDTSSKHYYDRMKRSESFQYILEALGIPELTESDLRSKVQKLRTSLAREMRKEKSSMKSGSAYNDVYTSKWRFYDQLQFLRPYITNKEVGPNMAEPVGHQDKDSQQSFKQEPVCTQSTEGSEDHSQLFQHVAQQHQSQNNNDGGDNTLDSSIDAPDLSPSPSASSSKRHMVSAPAFERRNKKSKMEDIALGVLSTFVSRQSQPQVKSDSENEHFAKYLLTQLVRLPPKQQRQARNRILTMLNDMIDEHEMSD